jgi:hypothetical protein
MYTKCLFAFGVVVVLVEKVLVVTEQLAVVAVDLQWVS